MNAIAEPMMFKSQMQIDFLSLIQASPEAAAPAELHHTSDSRLYDTVLTSSLTDMHQRMAQTTSVDSLDFSNVENSAALICSVISQAISDSMPATFFRPNSKTGLFQSEVPDAYDGFMFLSTDRLVLYANVLGLDADIHVRRSWAKMYARWKAEKGEAIFANLIDHLVKLLCTNAPDSAVYLDAKAFQRGPQFNYWCNVGAANPEEVRADIEQRVIERSMIAGYKVA
ncbi:hypothetical protein ACKF11_13015 [Methylobacillus sp. Pita2]|uniref:hypothetical protein n=1 Tax=Methylobacillus sp. Pita2 TaxID=3383245 RepID=UPI0038B62FB8